MANPIARDRTTLESFTTIHSKLTTSFIEVVKEADLSRGLKKLNALSLN